MSLLMLKYPPSYHLQPEKAFDAIERDKNRLIRYIVEDELITQVTELTRNDRPVCLYKPNIEIKRFFETLRSERTTRERVSRILEEPNVNKKLDQISRLKTFLDDRYVVFLEEAWGIPLSDFDLKDYLKTKAQRVFSQIKSRGSF